MIRLLVVNTLKAFGIIAGIALAAVLCVGILGIALAIHPILTIGLLLLGAATFVGVITTYNL